MPPADAHQNPARSKLDGDARAYVVGQGKRTGHEYLFAFDEAGGKVLSMHTDGLPNGIGMPPGLAEAAADRSRRIVVHHNHPNSLPPSPADLSAISKFEGISRAVISGHDGSLYEVSPLQRGNIDRAIGAAARVLRGILKGPTYAGMTSIERDFVVMAARLDALSRAGIIELTWSLDPATGRCARQLEELSDFLYAAMKQAMGR
jgi:hypothetical protein